MGTQYGRSFDRAMLLRPRLCCHLQWGGVKSLCLVGSNVEHTAVLEFVVSRCVWTYLAIINSFLHLEPVEKPIFQHLPLHTTRHLLASLLLHPCTHRLQLHMPIVITESECTLREEVIANHLHIRESSQTHSASTHPYAA